MEGFIMAKELLIVDGVWAEQDAAVVKVGITNEKREELGEISYVVAPEVGAVVAAGDKLCEVETLKAVSDIMAPVSGKVVAINEEIAEDPTAMNEDALAAWICEIEVA